MSRDAHIPLALWISAALLAHVMGGQGAVEVAQTMSDRADLRGLVRAVRSELRPADTTFEVLLEESEPTPPTEEASPPDKEIDAEESDEPVEPDPEAAPPKPKPKPPEPKKEPPKKEEPKVELPKPEPPPPEPPPPPPPPLAPLVEAPPPPPIAAAPPPPLPPADDRLAIRQHVEKDQEDNLTANRIADDANNTEEETVAAIRSHDQDSADPTPGAHAGPKGAIGDSDRDDIAQSEDRAGDPTHAPGESAPKSTSPEHSAPPPKAEARVALKAEPASGAGQKAAGRVAATAPEAPPPVAGGAGPASPEVLEGQSGSYSLDPKNPGGDGKSRTAGRRRAPKPYQAPVQVAKGLPGVARLSQEAVVAAVGEKQLAAERAADGASRRSKHRGSWESNKFERWRAAIENYEPTVKIGNQTALNAARVPFATYINTIHNRLHPIFAEEFLASLDDLSSGHGLNQELITHLEIVLSKDTGSIVRLGVTKASGVTAFDIAALNSVSRASPYGLAPDAIVSPDGNVYLHWEFHRDPYDACTTRHARPYLLREAPPAPREVAPPRRGAPPSSDDDRPIPGPLLPLRDP